MEQSLWLIYQGASTSKVCQWIKQGYRCVVEVLDEGNTVRKVSVSDFTKEELQSFFDGLGDSDYSVWVYKNISLRDRFISRLAILHAKTYLCLRPFTSGRMSITLPSISLRNGLHISKETILLYHHPALKVLEYSPPVISSVSKDVRTILVTGTNGKTTVTKMIYTGFRASGIPVVCNRNGANVLGGVYTQYFNNIRFGKPAAKWAVIECDERYMMDVAPILRPEIIVVTNISTDQVSRLHGVSTVKRYIERAVRDSNPRYVVCDEQLNLDISGTSSEIIRFSPNEQYHSVIPGRHNILNVAAAVSTLTLVGLKSDKVKKAVFETTPPPGRFEKYIIGGNAVTLMLAKNQAGLSLSLEYAEELGKINLILIMNDLYGDDKNPGWLTDGTLADDLENCDISRLYFGGSLGEMLVNHYAGSSFPVFRNCALIRDASEIIPTVRDAGIPTVIIANFTASWTALSVLRHNKSRI